MRAPDDAPSPAASPAPTPMPNAADAHDHDRIHAETPSLPLQDDEVALEDVSTSSRMLSAVTGSIITSLLVTPLDVVRIRLQSQTQAHPNTTAQLRNVGSFTRFSNLPPNLGVTACCREVFWVNNNSPFCVAGEAGQIRLASYPGAMAVPSPHLDCEFEEVQRKTFTSTFDGLRKIARNEGLTTLWRGLSPTLVMAVPGNVIYFAGYDWLRMSPKSPFRRVSNNYQPLVAGSAARVFAALFVSPIELFRTRMQARHSKDASTNFKETVESVREMVRNQGIHTLWRGLSLTLWRDVPFSAFYWWGYEATRGALVDMRDFSAGRDLTDLATAAERRKASRDRLDNTATSVDSFIAGAVSGFASSIVTTPFDVGKTRQQVLLHAGDSKSGGARTQIPEFRSMPRFLLHIYREEGLAGLFRGWSARCLKVAPACAIMISSYELGKKVSANMKKDD